MKKIRKTALSIGAFLVLSAMPDASLWGTNTLIYKTLSSTTNIRRGALKEGLLHFSLTLSTNSASTITVSQIGFLVSENPSGQGLFRNGQLFSVSGDRTNQIASAPPVGVSNLIFLLQDNLVFTNNAPREFLIKGDFLLDPAANSSWWTNTAVDLLSSANGFTTTPPVPLSLTNSDSSLGGFIFHRIRVYDNLLNVNFTHPTPPTSPSVLERGKSHMIMGFTLSNVNFPMTGEPFTVNNLTFSMLPGENAFTRVNIYQDNGDGTPDSTTDTLLTTYTPDPASTEHTNITIPLSTPILMDHNTRLIWVEAVTDPNIAGGNLYMELDLSDENAFAYRNKISLQPPYTKYASTTYTIADTTPPGALVNFAAVNGNGNLMLTWTNPGDGDLTHVRFAYNFTGLPVIYNSATYIDYPVTPGASWTTVVSNIGAGPIYYSLYTRDSFNLTNLSHSGTYSADNSYDSNPSIPTGVTITPHSDKIEISWDNDNNPGHYAWSVRFFSTHDFSTIYPNPEQFFLTNHIFLNKSDLGIPNNSWDVEMYVSVVNINLNGLRSINDFSNSTEAYSRGIRVYYSSSHQYTTSTVYNNFFQPDTGGYCRILISTGSEENVLVKVYSISGELMQTLVNSRIAAGNHEYRWYGKDGSGIVNPGVYIAHVRVGNHNKTHKIIVRR